MSTPKTWPAFPQAPARVGQAHGRFRFSRRTSIPSARDARVEYSPAGDRWLLGAQITTWAGKFAIARRRSDSTQAVSETSPSLPSGHATASMALYGFLAYALVRDLPGRRERFEVTFWIAMLIATVGFSRSSLSVHSAHYATDVPSGFMVGVFWLLVGFAVSEWFREGRNDAWRPDGGSGAGRTLRGCGLARHGCRAWRHDDVQLPP